MNGMPRITVAFNVAMFSYCVLQGLVRFVVSDKAKGVPLEGLIFTSIVDLVRVTILMFITAYFVREFWNRFVMTVFGLRKVDTNESIALVLLPSIWIW